MMSGLNTKAFKSRQWKALKDIPGVILVTGGVLNPDLLGGHPGGALSQWLIYPHGTTQEHSHNSLRGSLFTQQKQTWGCFCSQVSYRVSGKQSIISGRRFKLLLINLCGFTVKLVGLKGELHMTLHSRGPPFLSFQLIFHFFFLKPPENRSRMTCDVWCFRPKVDI